ncbi:MAG TPA: hypothetical protein QF353_02545 [Gammaproteobacteria bacterium]|nr:hypothetical protein [Gammaproteobacteria bacterium]
MDQEDDKPKSNHQQSLDEPITIQNIPKTIWTIIFGLLGPEKQLWLFSITQNPTLYFSEGIKISNRLDLPSFNNSYSIPSSYYSTLHSKCENITSLKLQWNITDEALGALTENLKGLTDLNLRACDDITDSGLAALASNCENVTSLNLRGCRKITDETLSLLVQKFSKTLKSLDLSLAKIPTNGFKTIALNCPNLTSLNLKFTRVSDKDLNYFVFNCRKLRRIDLEGCRSLSSVTYFNLTEGEDLNEEVKKIAHMQKADPTLKAAKLKVIKCTLTDPWLAKLIPYIGNLQHLILWECKITDAGIKTLKENCKELNYFKLDNCTGFSHNDQEDNIMEIVDNNASNASYSSR